MSFEGQDKRPSIQELFSPSAVANSKSTKLQRLSASLSWRQRYQTAQEYVYEFNNSNKSLRVSQVTNGEMKGLGTGTFVWPAAHVLAKFLENNFNSRDNIQLNGARVCEIGSGTGMTGLVAASLGAEVYLTDQDPILPLLASNVARACSDSNNNIMDSSKLHVCIYDWGNQNHVRALCPPFDMLLISDCVLPKLYPIEPLVQSVNALLGDSSVAYFSYEHRPHSLFDPRHEFSRLAAKYGLHVEIVPFNLHDKIYSAEDIEIWEVRRSGRKDMPPILSVMNSRRSIQNNNESNSAPSSLCSSMFEASSLHFDGWGDLNKIQVQMRVSHIDGTLGEKKSFMLPIYINQVINSTTGSYLWPSSAILSRYLLVHYCIGGEKNNDSLPLAIDLGAGCGLTTIALIMTGFKVIATDKECSIDILNENLSNFKSSLNDFLSMTPDQDTEQNICRSYLHRIAANAAQDEPELIDVVNVDWAHLDESKINISNSLLHQGHLYPDVIVCSDCLYASSSAEALVATLENLCGPNTILYVCNQLRSVLDEFLSYTRKSSDYSRGYAIEGTWEIDELLLSQSDHTVCRDVNGLVISPPLRFFKMKFTRTNN